MEQQEIAISVNNLKKSFGNIVAVNNISLEVGSGEIFGFLGPNGSGKTTTIRMICGLMLPDNCEGHCLGYNIMTESDQIKKKIGYMTQHFSLYKDLTVRENIDFVARIYQINNRQERIEKIIDQFEFRKSQVNQITDTLSGGWKQRLALACAIVHDPKLLLLDEPTAGVDPKARREFWNHIHFLSEQGITTLVSTHYMDEAERCHRVAYISSGKILTTGTIDEVIENAKLSLWTVTGKNTKGLADRIKTMPSVSHVTPFGKIFHVIGYDSETLEKDISKFGENDLIWQKAIPSIEDVFISLITDPGSIS